MVLRTILGSVIAAAVLLAGLPAPADDAVVIADFEGADYGDWTVSGVAFGPGPAQGTLPRQNHVSGYLGKGLVNSYYEGDDSKGKLVSPPFELNRPYLNLLVGGGPHVGKTCVNILVDDVVVVSLTGPASERLDWQTLDLATLQGKSATIEIIDDAVGGWGHINVDHIELSPEPRASALRLGNPDAASRTMTINRPYLHLPVKTGAAKQRMRLLIGHRLFDEFDIELAPEKPDFHVYVDLTQFLNQTLAIEFDDPEADPAMLEPLFLSEMLPGDAGLYRETYRPQFHFSPRRGWNNDPNGLVYFQGEYHLYFQHNPYGRNWGNMHWGHAVSRNLVHWEELPVALNPRSYGDWAFSGSAVIDWKNTGGFQRGPEPPLVIAYTSTGRGECIAYSNDRGRTFTEFPGNPVVKHDGRDPKIIWHGPTNQWVMAVYEILGEGTPEKKQTIGFYTSPNLRDWTHRSNLDGYFECPEIFALPVDGNRDNTRWVVYGADNEYTIGQFDGATFTPEGGKQKGNYGNCLYAAQTFSDIPDADGRRIEIGWGKVGHPDMPFNQQMLFPTSLSLQTTPEGIRLFKEPVWEIESLHDRTTTWTDLAIAPGANALDGESGELLHVETVIEPRDATSVTLTLRGVPVVYDVAAQTLRCGDKEAPLPPRDGAIQLEVLVDRLTVEVFGNQGAVYMPMGITLDPADESIALTAEGGTAKAKALVVSTLKSAW